MRKRIAETIYGRVNQTTGTKGFRTLANVSLTNAAISLFVTNKSTDKTTLLAAINLDHNSGKCRDIDLFFSAGMTLRNPTVQGKETFCAIQGDCKLWICAQTVYIILYIESRGNFQLDLWTQLIAIPSLRSRVNTIITKSWYLKKKTYCYYVINKRRSTSLTFRTNTI